MPEVSGNFCRDGYGWVAGAVRDGAALHFLCSECWHGTCDSTMPCHTFFCARFFHLRKFKIPAAFHSPALAAFFGHATVPSDADEQVCEYCRCLLRSYAMHEVLELARRHPRLRRPLALAVSEAAAAGRWRVEGGAPLQLRARCVLNVAETCVLPRELLPSSMSGVFDHAEPLPTTLLAACYLDWLHRAGRVHPADFPALRRVIDAVLCRLPAELGALVTRHLYHPASLGCGADECRI